VTLDAKRDGAVLNSDTGKLTLDTGTLGFKDILDHDTGTSICGQVGVSYTADYDKNGDGVVDEGSGGPGGNLSGGYASHDIEQTTKATVGEGTIVIRDKDKQKQDVAALNRDVDQAQVITKNERSGVDVYVSSSAVQELAAGLEGISGNLQKNFGAISGVDPQRGETLSFKRADGTTATYPEYIAEQIWSGAKGSVQALTALLATVPSEVKSQGPQAETMWRERIANGASPEEATQWAKTAAFKDSVMTQILFETALSYTQVAYASGKGEQGELKVVEIPGTNLVKIEGLSLKNSSVIPVFDKDFAPAVVGFIAAIEEKGVNLVINEGFRTSEMQKLLTGNKYGGAKAGNSLHEAGWAIDVRMNDTQKALIVKAAKDLGMRWGGDFRKYDPVHFDINPYDNQQDRQTAIQRAQEQYQNYIKNLHD
jgi:hypothetical protein